MRRIFLLILLLSPMCATASENLIEIKSGHNATITDGVVHQITADDIVQMRWKIVAVYNNQKHWDYNGVWSSEVLAYFIDDNIGLISYNFTTPSDLDDLLYFRFGLNGTVRDTLVLFDIKDVMPNTTYTLQWQVLNNTQGEIAWTDMFLTRCDDGYALVLGDKNCSRACENQSVSGGYIPPDVARVYAPATCVYDTSRLVCDTGYAKIDNTCIQMCAAGIAHLHIGDASYGLYAQKGGGPALHVRYKNNVCYGHLVPGIGAGLNVHLEGAAYHLID